jgi:hypothetical protein
VTIVVIIAVIIARDYCGDYCRDLAIIALFMFDLIVLSE